MKKFSTLALLAASTAMLVAPSTTPPQVYKGKAENDMTTLRFEYSDSQEIVLTVDDEGSLNDIKITLVDEAHPTQIVVALFDQLAVKQIDFAEDGLLVMTLKQKSADLDLSLPSLSLISPMLAQIIGTLSDTTVPQQTDEDFYQMIEPFVKMTHSLADAARDGSHQKVMTDPIDA